MPSHPTTKKNSPPKKKTPPIPRCCYCGNKFEDTGCFEGKCQMGQQNDIRNYFNLKKKI